MELVAITFVDTLGVDDRGGMTLTGGMQDWLVMPPPYADPITGWSYPAVVLMRGTPPEQFVLRLRARHSGGTTVESTINASAAATSGRVRNPFTGIRVAGSLVAPAPGVTRLEAWVEGQQTPAWVEVEIRPWEAAPGE